MKKFVVSPVMIGMLGVAVAFSSAGHLWAGGQSASRSAELKLLSYRGMVAGALVVDAATLQPTGDAEARMIATRLGRGVQRFLQDEILVAPLDQNGQLMTGTDPGQIPTGIATFGIAHSVAADGDVLDIYFELYAPTALVESGPLPYTGNYTVLPTGTGRFAYPADAGNLGEGIIRGTALLIPGEVAGTVSMQFAHTFRGTLAQARTARRGDSGEWGSYGESDDWNDEPEGYDD
ncbi:MAG: hypothetical protein KDM81_05135 [Verrucomicrobiae bacterium]|nr:hypothetical protein [Verrucomicrobiae bacterium]